MNNQPGLFSIGRPSYAPPPLDTPRPAHSASTIKVSLPAYSSYLSSSGKSEATVRAYVSDLHQLINYCGDRGVNEFGLQDLRNFIAYQKNTRRAQPKSLYRYVTTMNSYFRWLLKEGAIKANPAEQLVYMRPVSPLPEILKNEEECRILLKEASKDPRDYLLVILLMEKGLKASEVLAIKEKHLDLSLHYRPTLWIEKDNAKKDRKVDLPPEFPVVYRDYIALYPVETDFVFPFSRMGLHKMIVDLQGRVGIKVKLSAQVLRDTCAARRIRAGEPPLEVMKSLGLSTSEDNRDILQKYTRLAERFGR